MAAELPFERDKIQAIRVEVTHRLFEEWGSSDTALFSVVFILGCVFESDFKIRYVGSTIVSLRRCSPPLIDSVSGKEIFLFQLL